MFRTMAVLSMSLFAMLSLAGCVLVVGDDDGFDRDRRVVRTYDRDVRSERRVSVTSSVVVREIEDAFEADPMLADQEITVVERDGVVTLHGRVSQRAAFDRAVDIVSATRNVDRVVSKLIVEMHTGD